MENPDQTKIRINSDKQEEKKEKDEASSLIEKNPDEESLREIEKKIIDILKEMNVGISFEKQTGAISIGMLVNNGSFILLNHFPIGQAAINGFSSAFGAITNRIASQVNGINNVAHYPITFIAALGRLTNGFLISLGWQNIGTIIKSLDVNVAVILSTVTAAFLQSEWFNSGEKSAETRLQIQVLKQLITEHVEISKQLDKPSPFNLVIKDDQKEITSDKDAADQTLLLLQQRIFNLLDELGFT